MVSWHNGKSPPYWFCTTSIDHCSWNCQCFIPICGNSNMESTRQNWPWFLESCQFDLFRVVLQLVGLVLMTALHWPTFPSFNLESAGSVWQLPIVKIMSHKKYNIDRKDAKETHVMLSCKGHIPPCCWCLSQIGRLIFCVYATVYRVFVRTKMCVRYCVRMYKKTKDKHVFALLALPSVTQ